MSAGPNELPAWSMEWEIREVLEAARAELAAIQSELDASDQNHPQIREELDRARSALDGVDDALDVLDEAGEEIPQLWQPVAHHLLARFGYPALWGAAVAAAWHVDELYEQFDLAEVHPARSTGAED